MSDVPEKALRAGQSALMDASVVPPEGWLLPTTRPSEVARAVIEAAAPHLAPDPVPSLSAGETWETYWCPQHGPLAVNNWCEPCREFRGEKLKLPQGIAEFCCAVRGKLAVAVDTVEEKDMELAECKEALEEIAACNRSRKCAACTGTAADVLVRLDRGVS